MTLEFQAWPKTPRLFRDMVITEKIDGTNAAIIIAHVPDGPSPEDIWDEATMTRFVSAQPAGWEQPGDFIVAAQSRKRIITPDSDNFGFASWVFGNAQALAETLGEGRHFGEWWGSGVQRGYGLQKGEKRFSLFNVRRYLPLFGITAEYSRPYGLGVVPTLYAGPFDTGIVREHVGYLRKYGSWAAKGFMNPEGVVVYHSAANSVFKVTVEGDEAPKSVLHT